MDLAADGAVAAGPPCAPLSAFNDDALAEIELREPEERWETVDGREIQGWLDPVRGGGARLSPRRSSSRSTAAPTPSTAGRPYWEFQVLAGAGMSVLFTNPRGSEGYGEDFNSANLPDWGDGPMRDVMAHVDAAVAVGRGRPGPAGRRGWVLRRLPDELDRRPLGPLRRGDDVPKRLGPHQPRT